MILAREPDQEIAPLLEPAAFGLPSQRQVEALISAGFNCMYSPDVASVLSRLGCLVARTRTDGALWVYANAVRVAGNAMWVHEIDVAVYRTLKQRADSHLEALEVGVGRLVTASAGRPKRTAEQWAAAEAVMRLSGIVAFLNFLESR